MGKKDINNNNKELIDILNQLEDMAQRNERISNPQEQNTRAETLNPHNSEPTGEEALTHVLNTSRDEKSRTNQALEIVNEQINQNSNTPVETSNSFEETHTKEVDIAADPNQNNDITGRDLAEQIVEQGILVGRRLKRLRNFTEISNETYVENNGRIQNNIEENNQQLSTLQT